MSGQYTILMGLATLASLLVFVAYVIRSILSRELNYFDSKLNKQRKFDPISDWLGHGLHGVGMTYMGLVMMGITPAFIPFSWCVVFYALSAAVFAYRVGSKQYLVWWWDVLHIFMSVGMVYMFLDMSVWQPVITFVFTLYYLWLCWKYVRDYVHDRSITVPRRRFVVLLSDAGHVGIGLAMAIMLVVMQWPALTGMGGMGHRISNGDTSCADHLPADASITLSVISVNTDGVTLRVETNYVIMCGATYWNLYVDDVLYQRFRDPEVTVPISGGHVLTAVMAGVDCEYPVQMDLEYR